ncbi:MULTISPECIES: hypothetical protein [Brevibacillus]|uniref:hypothetical protein n=1 Tax=Brevibacillus TaxID=55080 RepID=UPI00156AEA0C|nr:MULTISPECIES: hypothetical protein [Brevibacillus]UED70185.1 hypothetical protein HP435_06035 [Brevibacillus sp. HD3.3A]WDV96483.1 hypothetical protein PSE45_05920 [Brevibacillus parabrevis]
MKKAVGFDQKILLHQLDYMAKEIGRNEKDDLYNLMDDYLKSDIAGNKSRLNARTIIFKIWYLVPESHQYIQQQAVQMYPDCTQVEKLLIHWGLTILAYSFFRDAVHEMGKLFKLQDELSSEQINRKMKNLYGDRRRIEVATSAVLTSLRSWNIIDSQKNTNRIAQKCRIENSDVKSWLVEVLLTATESGAMTMQFINDHPLLFPFEYSIAQSDLKTERFMVTRQGIDMVMIGLNKKV